MSYTNIIKTMGLWGEVIYGKDYYSCNAVVC
jgi:hypothetical protein